MSDFQAVFYRDGSGHEPVREFLLHIFAKRSAKLDRRDIRVAQERWEDFRARMDADPRVPPRAAGHDAP